MSGRNVLSKIGGIEMANWKTRGEAVNVDEKVCNREGCKHGGESQPIDNFSPAKETPDAHRSWCKDCYNEISQKRRDAKKSDNFLNYF